MAYPGTPVGQLFGPRQRMANTIPQVMSPNAPAFANPPGFAPAYAIPELEASFTLVTDRIHFQSGQEELTAERVALEANLQQEYRDRELLLRDELVELHFARFMSQQARAELQAWEAHQRELYETRFRALGHELHQHFAQQELNQEALSLRYYKDLDARSPARMLQPLLLRKEKVKVTRLLLNLRPLHLAPLLPSQLPKPRQEHRKEGRANQGLRPRQKVLHMEQKQAILR